MRVVRNKAKTYTPQITEGAVIYLARMATETSTISSLVDLGQATVDTEHSRDAWDMNDWKRVKRPASHQL